MTNYTLDTFIEDCRKKISECQFPADCVEQIAPAMYRLLNGDKSFLKPEHFCSDPDPLDLNTLAADIACFDIVEFMPECDPKGLAALTAAQLVWNAIGLIAR